MIVTSRTQEERFALYEFLHKHGILGSFSQDFQAIGSLNEELALKAVVGYNSFCRRTCSMHVYGEGDNWASKDLLKVVFDYPFRQLNLVQVFAPVAASNERALNLDKHLGFKEFAIIPNGWDEGEDLVILSMAKEDCRWLRMRNEKMAA